MTEINLTKKYEDDELIVSEKYLISKSDYRKLTALDDILMIYKKVNERNFAVVSYDLVVINKYNDTIYFSYSSENEWVVDEILNILSKNCKNAVFGYTNENSKYVLEHTVPKTDIKK